MAGAMAFQLGGERKLLTRCHHEAIGPPLKSFLFDHNADEFASPAACYAYHIGEALSFLRDTYRGLPLHDRLAILCPEADFLAALRPELEKRTAVQFPDWRHVYVSAAEAAAHVGNSVESRGLPGDGLERIVVDTVDQFDGLERLMVIAVGLDHPISDLDVAADGSLDCPGGVQFGAAVSSLGHHRHDRQTRSLLYRAITRAHMQIIVVNEFLSGGWLEFLGNVRLREDERFDADRALDRCETVAVEEVVSNEIEDALDRGARLSDLLLDAVAADLLRDEVARAIEAGTNLDTAVSDVLRVWGSDLRQVRAAVERAAREFDLHLADTDPPIRVSESSAEQPPSTRGCCDATSSEATLLEDMVLSVAILLRRGEAMHLESAAENIVKQQLEKQLHKRTDLSLQAAAAACDPSVNIPRGELSVLRDTVLAALQRGESMEAAARMVVASWRDLDDLLQRAFETHAASRCVHASGRIRSPYLAFSLPVRSTIERVLNRIAGD